ncbi:MAG: DUF1853 family protein [Cellulophaga sp.]|uniref:DUF1853 family protein n=1 Tax=Cellulophaga sp. TaxID=1972202 RepID=UPI0032640E31
MITNHKNIELQYTGYINTPLLWVDKLVYGLQQFKINNIKTAVFSEQLPANLRLGKRVERYVSAELNQLKSINVLAENIQIQNNKLTIGELDCILIKDDVPHHVEIIFKFYLFDDSVGNTEIEHWIGPNRNDTLLKKLTKLKEKQLPLLYNTHTKPLLKSLNVDANAIQQFVFFKAQLFIPFSVNVEFKDLNKECIKGFYIKHTDLLQFKDCKFYIPSKTNWLQDVQTQVNWLKYDEFIFEINTLITAKKSPLCWIKFPNGELQKFFVVWW